MILVCENNGFAEFTPRSAHTTVERVSDVVAPYGFARETVDGSDVPAVWAAFARLPGRSLARGRRPLLLECLTHRRRGHYEGDPEQYRDPLAEEEWQRRDPMPRLGAHAIAAGLDSTRPGVRGARARRARRRSRRRSSSPARARSPSLSCAASWSTPASRRPWRRRSSRRSTPRWRGAMRADERVIVLGEDVAEGGPYRRPPGWPRSSARERVRNTPISEGAVCGVAIGAAQAGLRPVVEIMFIDFITLALDQLVNQAAKAHFMSGGQLSVPLVLRTQGGAGERGGAQHSQSLEAWLTHVPGLKVVMPSSAADAAGLLASAIADPNPVVFVENKALYFRRELAARAARAGADRAGADGARRRRRDDRRDLADGRRGARGGRAARRRGDRGRGDRPAHAGAARPRHDRRARCGGPGGAVVAHEAVQHRRLRRRDRRPVAGPPRSTTSRRRSSASARRSRRSRSARRWRTPTGRGADEIYAAARAALGPRR